MICAKCKDEKHSECKGCTCQHRDRTTRNMPVYSERVAESIKLGSRSAVHMNAQMPPVDC